MDQDDVTNHNGNVPNGGPVGKKEKKRPPANGLLYAVDDVPPWHLSFLLGFQVPLAISF